MISRKNFLKLTVLSGLAPVKDWSIGSSSFNGKVNKPLVISTWGFGITANKEAWKVLS